MLQHAAGLSIIVAMLFDPLATLKSLGAVVSYDRASKRVYMTWERKPTMYDRRKAAVILKRFEQLLAIQMDVPDGTQPRTVQQLVAAKKIRVVNGRYMRGQ